MSTAAVVYQAQLPPLRAASPVLRRVPPDTKARAQYSPQGIFNKRRPAGAGTMALRDEWRYQLQGRRQPQASLDELVVVEGFNDMVAVARAVDAEVFVLGGALFVRSAATMSRLQAEAARHSGVLVLLDPDPAGRQGRALLDAALGASCRHAFVPGLAATAQGDTRQHTAGNLGVEHCSPSVIREAMARGQPSQPDRREFSRDDLIGWQLVTPMGSSAQGVSNAPRRRELVGLLLGFGRCDGKQLLLQLNRYGVPRAAVKRALAHADSVLAS